jgi:hypothetical protein
MTTFSCVSDNKNIHNVEAKSAGRSYPICSGVQYVIPEYLDIIESVINGYVSKWPRTLAIRIDLRFPEDYVPSQKNYVGDFMRRLQSRIDADLARKSSDDKRVHKCELGYVWVREVGESCKPHYHVVILLNRNAYIGWSEYHPEATGVYGMIYRAWAAALGSEDMFRGTGVFFPESGVYRIDRAPSPENSNRSEFLTRLSYLAKVDTKYYGWQRRNIGYSR